MTTPQAPTPSGPELEEGGPHCPNCGAALAADQRYCVNCGHRLTEPRVDFRKSLALEHQAPPPKPRPSIWDHRGTLVTLAAVLAVLVALGVGIVIGRGSGKTALQANKPEILTVPTAVATAPASTSAPAAATSVSDDWPASSSGWTVELSSLSTTALASDVTAAESAARAKGATAVGVLNGSDHSGTPSGKYVIYTGHYASAKQADAAKAKLKTSFPAAIVLHVQPSTSGSSANAGGNSGATDSTQVKNLHKLTGSAYVKASSKLPSTIGSGGKPPPKEKGKAGGGTSGSCIGC
jgi:hypothetical protein